MFPEDEGRIIPETLINISRLKVYLCILRNISQIKCGKTEEKLKVVNRPEQADVITF
jgi:hypothetical protein